MLNVHELIRGLEVQVVVVLMLMTVMHHHDAGHPGRGDGLRRE